MKSEQFVIELASREWARQFYTSVVKSFAKSVTEPITNSDTSYKRQLKLSDASGLLEKAFSLSKGQQFDMSQAKLELERAGFKRDIEIHLYTAKGYKLPPRTCEIVDHAEGMSPEELKGAFKEFAADKSGVSKGRPGRSLFGRGVSDVLLGHKGGMFFSCKDGVLSKLDLSFDPQTDKQPKATLTANEKPKNSELKDLHLIPGTNGSCVRFTLHEDCPIPDEGTIVPLLTQFYMLRLINADPNTNIKVIRYRAGSKHFEDRLDYDFPIGDVIEKFSFTISDPVPGASLKPLQIRGIVARATLKEGLPGKEARDQRANGLLIVDDKDAILDLTFLPQFEDAPYLRNIFGIIRIDNIRDVLAWYLNNGKDSPLTPSRDGFDPKHEFSRLLFKEMAKYLEPVYRREEERYNRSASENLSKEARQRLNEAIKEINKLLKDLIGEGEGAGPDEPVKIDPEKDIQFVPPAVKLVVGKMKVVSIFLRKQMADVKSGNIVLDTANPKIVIKPLSVQIGAGRERGDWLVYSVSLNSDSLHETGRITALADGADGTLEGHLDVLDVTSGVVITPPETMEFRPKESHGQPSRTNNAALWINADVIPLGRNIKIEIEKSHGAIGLHHNGKRTNELVVKFEKSHLLPNINIGRILIPWGGTGWGQSASLSAATKKPDGSLVVAEGRIALAQPEESAGIIRDVKYRDLANEKCSDLVDGIIYINSNHQLNRVVFGANQDEYNKKVDEDRTAQYRLAALVVEQSVFRVAEDSHNKGRVVIVDAAPVTSLREFIDQKTNQFAPKILKALMTR